MGKQYKKKKSDINTSMIVFLKVFAFLIPILLYILFSVIIFPSPNSGFLFLGVVGSLILGIGFISVTGLVDGLYFGHTITSISIAIGFALIIISSLIMYIPSVYSMINERYISFYFLVWLSLTISAIWYMFFRMGVSHFLRDNKISKTAIEKAMEGASNYWWYEEVNKKYKLGWMYHINKWFTLFYSGAILVHLLVGWWKPMSPLVLLLACLICIVDVALWIPVIMTRKKAKLNKKKKADTISLAAVLGFLFPLFICVALILYFLKYST